MEVGERKPYTGIPGAWNLLETFFSVCRHEIARLAEKFQQSLLQQSATIWTQLRLSKTSSTSLSLITYKRFDSFEALKYFAIHRPAFRKLWGAHENDICIQAVDVHPLREIEAHLRQTSPQEDQHHVRIAPRIRTDSRTEQVGLRRRNSLDGLRQVKGPAHAFKPQ